MCSSDLGLMMLVATMGYGLAVVVFALSHSFVLSMAMMAMAGLCHVHSNGLVQTVIQSHSPPEFRGRTLAIFSLNQVLITVGALLLGALADNLGPREAMAIMGATGFVAMLAMYFAMPYAREIR